MASKEQGRTGALARKAGTPRLKNKKSLGQHWLKNREILAEIAGLAADGLDTPVCLEIGPGLGTLTSSLLKQFLEVVAVEFDADLARKLPASFPGKNLEVIQGDILDHDFTPLGRDFVVAGNIPYYITSPIIEKLLHLDPAPRRIVLLIQKEVAERIAGERENLLSLEVKNRAEVKLGPVVKRDEFTPPPKVDSQVIILKPHAPEVKEEVFELIRRGFAAPRKKLIHNLAGMASTEELKAALKEIGVDENARPGDLPLLAWAKLHEKLLTNQQF